MTEQDNTAMNDGNPDTLPTIDTILLSFSDPNNNKAGHHNVVFAKRAILALKAKWQREARNNADQEGYHRGVSDFSRWFMDASLPAQRQSIFPDIARDLHDNYRPPIIFPSAHMFDAPPQPLNNKGGE